MHFPRRRLLAFFIFLDYNKIRYTKLEDYDMKRLCIGILAHVDSGKTTLCEGLLYAAGEIRTLGRVDHKDAFLDTNEIERDRGITIFSKQAVINAFDTKISLLDTPGHVDFSAETERTLRVLDYAILVISGSEGVQSHTKTLWNLLSHYGVPTFIFINKMDLPETDRESILSELQTELSGGCIDFENIDYEQAATLDETLFEEYMESECLSEASIKNAISGRKIFPCFFGSALRNEGVDSFLGGVCKYTSEKKTKSEFGAKVFKISEDERGVRLTHIKVTSGSLKTKTVIGDNKINEMRIYSGVKFTHATEVFAGEVAAVTGLPESYPGMGLGCEADSGELTMEPVFTYSVVVPDGTDVHSVLTALRKIEQEETQMHVLYNELLQKIDVQIMGMVQLEVLKRILADRFSIDVEFEHGNIIYKETIANTVEGVGHYEPLRHYSEVHLLLEPGKRGSGLVFRSACSEDVLDRNWQRLIMTHLKEKTHLGVLTGSPITDIRITLVNGRAHQKHTEGGDFRQSTYRAVRQGLMMAESVLLEPYYNFVLEVPFDKTGRAMTDLQQLGAEFGSPVTKENTTVISGSAPVSRLRDYHLDVISYTHGEGTLSVSFGGYMPCQNTDEVIEKIGYNAEADTVNSADSVFCERGAGFTVKWNEVYDYMHIPLLSDKKKETEPIVRKYEKITASEEELLKIYESVYGKIKRELPRPMKTPKTPKPYKEKPIATMQTYLLIDGYNIIFANDELKAIAEDSFDAAREILIRKVCNYKAVRPYNIILVFDAYKVKGARREIEEISGITVVYTKEAETADAYIEKTSKELAKNYRVRVATSDGLEQIIIFSQGAMRIPASEFLAEIELAENEIRDFIKEYNK